LRPVHDERSCLAVLIQVPLQCQAFCGMIFFSGVLKRREGIEFMPILSLDAVHEWSR
jgi:hypothetical protein